MREMLSQRHQETSESWGLGEFSQSRQKSRQGKCACLLNLGFPVCARGEGWLLNPGMPGFKKSPPPSGGGHPVGHAASSRKLQVGEGGQSHTDLVLISSLPLIGHLEPELVSPNFFESQFPPLLNGGNIPYHPGFVERIYTSPGQDNCHRWSQVLWLLAM